MEQVTELKYLGIHFDSRFCFDRHVEYITAKCTPILNMMVKSAKLNWGIGHQALKVIYNGASEPILTYGAPVWEKALTKHNNLSKYQRIQRMMNIKIAKAFRSIVRTRWCPPHSTCY